MNAALTEELWSLSGGATALSDLPRLRPRRRACCGSELEYGGAVLDEYESDCAMGSYRRASTFRQRARRCRLDRRRSDCGAGPALGGPIHQAWNVSVDHHECPWVLCGCRAPRRRPRDGSPECGFRASAVLATRRAPVRRTGLWWVGGGVRVREDHGPSFTGVLDRPRDHRTWGGRAET